MLILKDFSAGYGPLCILRHLNLSLASGEVLAVLGHNGAGRSTLLKAIMGWTWGRGQATWQGSDLLSCSIHERAQLGLAYVPETRDVFADLSVNDNLSLGAGPDCPRRERQQRLSEVYDQLPLLAQRRRQRASVLSGGEQQLLAMARCWMSRPKLMLLDEPTEGLSPSMTDQVLDWLMFFRSMKLAIILVEQKTSRALALCDHVLALTSGQATFQGRVDDYTRWRLDTEIEHP